MSIPSTFPRIDWQMAGGATDVLPPSPAPVQKDSGSLAYPSASLFWSLGGMPSSTGVPVSPLTAVQVATVYGCVKARSEDLGKIPFVLQESRTKGGWRTVRNHPIARLLRRPNPHMTPFVFKRFVEMSLCYRGNAYVHIKRGIDGAPVKLTPLIPDVVVMEVSPSGEIFYRINHTEIGQGVKVHYYDMLHFKNLGMDNGSLGMSPIAAAQESIGLAIAAQQHGAVLFRQGAQLNGVLKHPLALSKEAKEGISRDFAEMYSGVQNAHKTPVLEEGMSFEKMTMTNTDAQFLELRKFQRTEICAIFRVPPHKVMDLERATFSNIEAQNQSYVDEALMPDGTQIAEECAAKLLFDDEQDKYQFAWIWDDLLKADRKTRYEAHAIGLTQGFLSQNDVRRAEGMETIPDGDVYRVPLNVGEGGIKPEGSPPGVQPTQTPRLPATTETAPP